MLARTALGMGVRITAPPDQRQVMTTIAETGALVDRAPAFRRSPRSRRRTGWVLEAVLAGWLAQPDATWWQSPQG